MNFQCFSAGLLSISLFRCKGKMEDELSKAQEAKEAKEAQDAKEAIIKKVYYDVKDGFGSIAATLKAANGIDSSIKRSDVTAFLGKQVHRQAKRRRKDNSYVPFGPREQFQVDLADFGLTGVYRYALVTVDIFTKKLVVIPINGKTSAETAVAFEEVFKILDVPNYVYSDEGGEFSGTFEAMLNDNLVKHITTRTSAAFVERSIRTLRDGVNVRLDALGLGKSQWWKMLPFVVNQYNSTAHTTTGVTPDDAAKLDWEQPGGRDAILAIRDTIADKAHKDLKYPLIAVGDRVKILRKPRRYGDFKSDFVAWSETAYRVEEITYDAGNPVFKLEGRPKALRLHEIFKVDGVEKAPKLKIKGKNQITAQLRRKRTEPAPEGAGEAEEGGGAEPVAAVLANPRLRVKTVDPKWNTIPVEARAIRKRVKTYDASWHQGNFVHPLNAQIFI